MHVLQVVEQARVGAAGQDRQPALAKSRLELLLAGAHQLVDFVQQQHAGLIAPGERTLGNQVGGKIVVVVFQ